MKKLLTFLVLTIPMMSHAGFEQEPNNDMSTASALNLNEVYSGAFSSNSSNYDYYKFTISADTNINLTIQQKTESSEESYFYILNSSGNSFFNQEIPAYDTSEYKNTVGLKAGTYFFKAYNYYSSSSSNYEFSLISDLTPPKPLTIPNMVSSVGLKDTNGNGADETAFLKIQSDTKAIVEIIDNHTKAKLKKIIVSADSRAIQPINMTSYTDSNNDQVPDFGILFLNRSTGGYLQTIYDPITGKALAKYSVSQ